MQKMLITSTYGLIAVFVLRLISPTSTQTVSTSGRTSGFEVRHRRLLGFLGLLELLGLLGLLG